MTSTRLTLCPQCSRLRTQGRPCPYCVSRQEEQERRAARALILGCGVLGLVLLALLLSSCSGADTSAAGIQPPARRTLSEIRAEALGEAGPTPALAPVAIPTAILPAALPPDEVDWAAWALSLGYRWCATIDGQQMLMGAPDGPRPIEPDLKEICP